MNSVVNCVDVEGKEVYLVVSESAPVVSIVPKLFVGLQLQEFGSRYEAEMLKSSKKTDMADLIVYVHDSSDTNSFSYISNLRVSLPYEVIHPYALISPV